MNPKIACVVLVICTALLGAPGAAHAQVENIAQQWAGFWNAKNLPEIMKLYAPEPVFLPASGGRWAGAPAIRKRFVEELRRYDPRLTMQSVTSGSSGNIAYDSGNYDEIAAPTNGGRAVHIRGSYVFVFERRKRGGWKILEQSWTGFDPAKL
jgi:ketosteroid isomerase-like protein